MPERIWAIKWKYKEELTAWDSPSSGSEETCYIRESIIGQRAKVAAAEIGDKMAAALSGEKPIDDIEIAKIILNTLKGQ